jgi:uncharacterized oxidoreductase
MRISVDGMTALAQAIVEKSGSRAEVARQVSENLVAANLAGHDSHGVGMLPYYMGSVREGKVDPEAEASIEMERGPYLLVDGNRGFGQVIGRQTMEIGIARAREMGIAVVALKNSFHIGRIGAWGKMCADAGFISIHYVSDQQSRHGQGPGGLQQRGRNARGQPHRQRRKRDQRPHRHVF